MERNNYRSNSGVYIKINMGGFQIMAGNFEKASKKGRGKRSRTLKTYNNKLYRLKSRYTRFSKNEKFKTKYPTFESFLEKIPLKRVMKKVEKSYTSTITSSKTQRKRSVWGI